MKTLKMTAVVFSLFLAMSCYSVHLKVSNGPGGEPADTETEEVNAGNLERVYDTVVTVGFATDENPINIRDCTSGSLHSIEYKTTFGGALLNLVTLGRKRVVRVKYVCTKKQNDGEL